MSKYTIELGTACKAVLGGAGETWKPSLDSYPIFDEAYRTVLNKKIVDHYYFSEIGLETIERFDHYLKERMNLIMPKYNKMYSAYLLDYNPLYNSNLQETNARTIAGTNSGTTGGSASSNVTTKRADEKNTNIESDTPSGNINIANVETGGYASKFNIAKQEFLNDETNAGTNSNTQTSSGEMQTTESYTRSIVGFSGANVNELLASYVKNIVNIDEMIINDLRDLFMQVY